MLFNKIFVGVFCQRFLEKFERMGQQILQAKLSDLVEPGFWRLCCRTENVESMVMDDAVTQSADHSKYR